MKHKLPLVSIIMPIYNAQEYMKEAVESLLSQTYKNIEIILVDDQSTDTSWSIAQSFTKKYPKTVKAIQTSHKTNAAGNGAMNYGYTFAKGAYIARMDADDISLPKRIEKQVQYLTDNPEVILVGSQASVIDKSGKVIGKKTFPIEHADIYTQYGILHPIVHPSVMIRRSMLPNKKKIYEMKWDVNDDYYTFFKLLTIGKFHNLPQTLLKYRVHGTNASLTNPKAKFWNSVKIRFAAIRDFGYKMSLKAWIMMAIQCSVISLIPESIIVPLYMYIRGMASQETQKRRSVYRLKPAIVVQ